MDPGQVKREWVCPHAEIVDFLVLVGEGWRCPVIDNLPCVWQQRRGVWWANYRSFAVAVAIGPFDTVEEAKAVAELPEFDTIMKIRWAAWKENNMKK